MAIGLRVEMKELRGDPSHVAIDVNSDSID